MLLLLLVCFLYWRSTSYTEVERISQNTHYHTNIYAPKGSL